MLMKTALTVLLAMMTLTPNAYRVSNQQNPEILSQKKNLLDQLNKITFRFELDDVMLNEFFSGVQFLPNYLPGDEKPIFIPTIWKNHIQLIHQKD